MQNRSGPQLLVLHDTESFAQTIQITFPYLYRIPCKTYSEPIGRDLPSGLLDNVGVVILHADYGKEHRHPFSVFQPTPVKDIIEMINTVHPHITIILVTGERNLELYQKEFPNVTEVCTVTDINEGRIIELIQNRLKEFMHREGKRYGKEG